MYGPIKILMWDPAMYLYPESVPPLLLVSSFFSVEPVAEAQWLVQEWELDLVGGLALVVHQSGYHLNPCVGS